MHRIDPRIVIIQIVLSGICAFWIFKPLAMLCEVLFLMSFLLYLQHPKEALRLGVWFAFLVGLYALLNESNAPQIIVQPVFLLRKLSPLLGVMVLSLKALTVSELFMGLQKLHCPKSATLALAVALRFIPTIRHELEQIRNGMKTRGVPLNLQLRLSGDLSKRIYASFVFSFIDSIVAMFPVGAVFYTLTKIQNNKAFAGNDWLVLFGILIISLVVRIVFKYLVYSFQSTAGFEFVSRERITLGDKLRNVGMGFFHERNIGDITTTGYLSEILEYSPERKGMESSTVDYDPQFVNLKDFASTNP